MSRPAHCAGHVDLGRLGLHHGRGHMKYRLAILLAAVAGGLGVAGLAPATDELALTPAAHAKACSSGYRHAALSWGHKCLRRGQFCKLSGDRAYHRYGYHCHSGRLT